jgi:DNA helicase-2/ATP-dependent DNA helicase PcrA
MTQPTILPSPTAPVGSVTHLGRYRPDQIPPGSAILCRNTAPLIAMCYSLITRHRSARVLGRDIGAGLISTCKKMRADSVDLLLERLANWKTREFTRLCESGEDLAAERILDQYDCILLFVNNLPEDDRTLQRLYANIESLFAPTDTDDYSGVTLSTIHKSKGLEWPTVFILDADRLQPSKYATQKWSRVQEYNLMYVAATRAQESLTYIRSGAWEDEANK